MYVFVKLSTHTMKYGLQTQPQKLVSFAVITIANIKYVLKINKLFI